MATANLTIFDEYSYLLHKLLPRGPAWSDADPLLLGIAEELARVHRRSDDLIKELNPGTTTELIDRYEKLTGLPDECVIDGAQTLTQRQQRLDAKINIVGGINKAFYEAQIRALGYDGTLSIQQYQNVTQNPEQLGFGELWNFYWEVTLYEDAMIDYFTTQSDCTEALRTWGNNIIECVIDKLKPSHTVVLYSYKGAI